MLNTGLPNRKVVERDRRPADRARLRAKAGSFEPKDVAHMRHDPWRQMFSQMREQALRRVSEVTAEDDQIGRKQTGLAMASESVSRASVGPQTSVFSTCIQEIGRSRAFQPQCTHQGRVRSHSFRDSHDCQHCTVARSVRSGCDRARLRHGRPAETARPSTTQPAPRPERR